MTPTVLAIDPGPEQSAWVLFDGERVLAKAIRSNAEVEWSLANLDDWHGSGCADHVAIEMIASYGMPVGAEVFETCCWIGRFERAWNPDHMLPRSSRLFRRDVKHHLCNSAKARDSNVRQALIDRFGPGKDKAIGTKKNPGPLYGVKADIWAALGVAVTWWDTRREG